LLLRELQVDQLLKALPLPLVLEMGIEMEMEMLLVLEKLKV
jgi:hypothetical protein